MSENGKPDDVEQYLKTTFLARIAHDIRGPAGVTQTAIEELENALGPSLAREHAALLGILKRSSRRILRVAEKLSRGSEAAQGPVLQVASARIRPIVERAVRESEAIEGRRNVSVKLDFDAAFDQPGRDTALIDASWFETLVIEVVSNALKHARSSVRVLLEETADQLVLSVADDGRSGSPKLRKLFEPSNERNGLGLSLSLAELVMRAQKGALSVGGAEGGGSTVSLRLPKATTMAISPAASSGNGKANVAAAPAARPRVLVVDDDADTVELVAYALERAGFAASSARTVSEAKAVIDSVHPDAIITDLSLPDGSGADLAVLPGAKLIKTKILVSGHSGQMVDRHTGSEGFDHRLVKPVDIDELIRILSRSLAKPAS